MASKRHVIIAGAGIAGLTAALALTRAGCRVTVFEQAAQLQETGAGIQLAPNATRVLLALGLRERLLPHVIAPEAIRVMSGNSGREIVRIPLGKEVARQYGAPYWAIHRGDLQAALAAAAQADPDIVLKLASRVSDFTCDSDGVQVQSERGDAFIGADGIWSTIAGQPGRRSVPGFAHRTAWRALIPADQAAAEFRARTIHLWLGDGAHVVHYPVKGGELINIVAIVHDEWHDTGWSAPGERGVIVRRFARGAWCDAVHALIAIPGQWLKWALYAAPEPFGSGRGPVTLIGDAAHPMLPFLAQGAAMAIEDAAVLADSLRDCGDDIAGALRRYESTRRARTARVQRAARAQGRIYGLRGPAALARNVGMRLMGGEALLARQDWLYGWQPPQLLQTSAE